MTTLKNLRTKCGYSQTELASKLQITRQYYHQLEKGLREPSVRLAKKVNTLILELMDEYNSYQEDEKKIAQFAEQHSEVV
jgi:DNA-binding XRE family transcriptional regulator